MSRQTEEYGSRGEIWWLEPVFYIRINIQLFKENVIISTLIEWQ